MEADSLPHPRVSGRPSLILINYSDGQLAPEFVTDFNQPLERPTALCPNGHCGRGSEQATLTVTDTEVIDSECRALAVRKRDVRGGDVLRFDGTVYLDLHNTQHDA